MRLFFTFVLGLLAATSILLVDNTRKVWASTSELFVSDPVTGLAIFGYDPVAYFTEHQPRKGQEGFEVTWRGAHWRFENAANGERFLEAPEFYAPRFNGYGAFGLVDNRLTEGNPLIWALYNNQLFFFHSVKARYEWAQDPQVNLEKGAINWKTLKVELAR